MSQFIFKMPDLGEGTVEAEIIAWHTAPGATVAEDQIIVEVMTDKAAVEVPAPVSGRVVSVTGAPGEKVAVGSPLIVFEVGASGPSGTPKDADRPAAAVAPPAPTATVAAPARAAAAAAPPGRIMTSPANRRRAREA
jgi:2-oxoisovalerate dehydrogenase E2 component (dihydrolipoyl transacylase)